MAKQIGILTFHYALNYGAVLQAYALTRACEKCGHEVELINYYTHGHERVNRIISDSKRGLVKSVLYALLVAPNYSQLKRKRLKFKDFQKDYLKVSRRFKSSSELINNLPKKDIFITGSDQVFNPVSDDSIRVYFLSFEKKNGCKKIAYAPSFGISVFEESLKQRIGGLVKDFDRLSCREDDGASFLASITEKNVETVLDPVFLLDSKEWEGIELPCSTINDYDGRYLFVYDLNGRDNLISLAKKLQDIVGLPIVCLTTKKYLVRKYHVDRIILDAGPREFLSLINHAAFVITDSFHGVAFATIFKKQFIAYNALPKASRRIKSLLGMINLEERLIENVNVDKGIVGEIISRRIDYQTELNHLIHLSKSFLEESLD